MQHTVTSAYLSLQYSIVCLGLARREEMTIISIHHLSDLVWPIAFDWIMRKPFKHSTSFNVLTSIGTHLFHMISHVPRCSWHHEIVHLECFRCKYRHSCKDRKVLEECNLHSAFLSEIICNLFHDSFAILQHFKWIHIQKNNGQIRGKYDFSNISCFTFCVYI